MKKTIKTIDLKLTFTEDPVTFREDKAQCYMTLSGDQLKSNIFDEAFIRNLDTVIKSLLRLKETTQNS